MSEPMPDLTPPQISEERIDQLWDAIPKFWPSTRADRAVFAQAVADEINRQWLEMLGQAAWMASYVDPEGYDHVYVTTHHDLAVENDMHGDPVRLYRIKEQG